MCPNHFVCGPVNYTLALTTWTPESNYCRLLRNWNEYNERFEVNGTQIQGRRHMDPAPPPRGWLGRSAQRAPPLHAGNPISPLWQCTGRQTQGRGVPVFLCPSHWGSGSCLGLESCACPSAKSVGMLPERTSQSEPARVSDHGCAPERSGTQNGATFFPRWSGWGLP